MLAYLLANVARRLQGMFSEYSKRILTIGTDIVHGWAITKMQVSHQPTISAQHAFVAVVQFLQTAHPPQRKFQGRTPRVHRGFLATWLANGIHERVMNHVKALLDSAQDRSAVRVLMCGHSLGGAIATLAAFDMVRICNLSPRQVSCYTFGCPRVGNHSFAEEYLEVRIHCHLI
jgi:predicted lipase